MLAYVVFSGLFALLAVYPRRMLGLWELVIFHKLGITLLSAISLGSASGAVASDNPALRLIIDGVLVSLTIASYVLAKGWLAWKTLVEQTDDDVPPMPIAACPILMGLASIPK